MKVAFILLSDGLEYDDRIRKEMFSIRELLGTVEFKIFAFSGKNNRVETGILSYGVPYEYVYVSHREEGKKDFISMMRKEYSFYKQVADKTKDFDLLWCCDEQPFFFPLFSNKPVIWDLHEIPASLSGSYVKNKVFHLLERRSKCLIHANQERADYLLEQGVLKQPQKNLIIRNYPDRKWLAEQEQQSENFKAFKKWLGNEEYVYIQGIQSPARYPWETLSAILEAKCIKAVIIGNVQKDVKERVSNAYPDADNYIYYAGQMIQSETAAFLAHCKFSIIFYDDKTPNNRYCEPNRMFQSLGLGIPVIVGYNEPMRDVVVKYGNGIALESDGRSIGDNVKGIKTMMNDYDNYKIKSEQQKDAFVWESQNEVLIKSFHFAGFIK